jgi:hypothetical protein
MEIFFKVISNKYVKMVLVGVAIAVVFFLVGRDSVHPTVKTEVVTKTEVQYQDKIQYQDRIVTKTVYVKVAEKKTHKEEHIITHPDGSKEVVKTTDTDTTTKTSNNTNTTNDQKNNTTVTDNTKADSETKTVVDVPKADWHVSVLAGSDLNTFHVTPLAPYVSPILIGVSVERRVIGPFYMGTWAISNRTGGISLGVEW